MLFNSFDFLLVFLPITYLIFLVASGAQFLWLATASLIVASLIFHGYWKASYTWLFVVSMATNYLFGLACSPPTTDQARPSWRRRLSFVLGISFNLGLLGYFEYAEFGAGVIWSFTGHFIDVGEIVLPLAISFYTFQQIAFLADTYAGTCRRYSFFEYVSYLAFFPHLIAGPIVRHDTLIRQLNSRSLLELRAATFLSGVAIIMIGLFKKVVLADTAASYVDPVFYAADTGGRIGFVEGWIGAVLFSFVIYFDFSGYSDIAIGLARLFNVRFPENFASPYKAANIQDFWRRWHITLSRFLRNYLYIPLGGNRRGDLRRHANLLITMLLGGLWHGAGWNFVIWGGLHGIYLVVFRMWRALIGHRSRPKAPVGSLTAGRIITYLAVVIAWVLFRATSLDQAGTVLGAMSGAYGFTGDAIELPDRLTGEPLIDAVALAVALWLIVNYLPSTQEYLRLFRPVHCAVFGVKRRRSDGIVWTPTFPHVLFVTGLGLCAMALITRVEAFIYFRF